jgi:hypothetical protein
MTQEQLKKAINLAKKTGDKLIIFDSPDTDQAAVVMSLDEYEKIAIKKSEVRNLTETEFVDRINRDIAIWKNEQEAKEVQLPKNSNYYGDLDPNDQYDEGKPEPNTDFYSYPGSPSLEDADEKNKKPRSHWAIPQDRKAGAEEIIDEDRQYLEEVMF